MSLEKEFLEKLEHHKKVVFKISKMYVNDTENRNDLYQEIVYQAWRAYPRFRGESKFSTWLYRVALNTAITYLKKEKKSPLVREKGQSTFLQSEEYTSEKEEQIEKMYEAIEKLNPIDKALIFYYLEGFSGEEMAKELGISQGNARVKLNRAKNKLKTFINK